MCWRPFSIAIWLLVLVTNYVDCKYNGGNVGHVIWAAIAGLCLGSWFPRPSVREQIRQEHEDELR